MQYFRVLAVAVSVGLAAYTWLAVQYYWPQEDDFMFGTVWLAAVCSTFVVASGRRGFTGATARRAIHFLAVPSAVGLCAILAMFLREAAGAAASYTVLFLVFAGPLLVLAGFVPRLFPAPVARLVCLVLAPSLLIMTLGFAPLYEYKRLWPWSAFRQQLLALDARATKAATQLGLPAGQYPTPEQAGRWAALVRLEESFEYPLLGKTIRAKATQPGVIMLYFGDGRFGRIEPTSMYLLYVGD